MINGIMRKLGYINEKKLIDATVEVYERNDEAKAEGRKRKEVEIRQGGRIFRIREVAQ